MSQPSRFRCAGCGAVVEQLLPLRCPGAHDGDSDGVDHLLVREPAIGLPPVDSDRENPFLRYRARLHAYQGARTRGLSDQRYCEIVERLDGRVAAVDGHGFTRTPLTDEPRLAAAIGLGAATLSVKDETGNVAGSHKGRHLFGVALALELADAIGQPAVAPGAPLAIASCGNAALAAAVIARAAERALDVYIPPDADSGVVDRLRSLGARLTICERERGVPGDPCYLRFRVAVASGAFPLSCQGPDCALTIDGGRTLAWEIAEQRPGITAIYVQVGGGALGSALAEALADSAAAGAIPRMPRFHTVQTEAAWPLRRAWRAIARPIARSLSDDREAPRDGLAADRALADALADVEPSVLDRAVDDATRHRGPVILPWETPPHSIAHGILDDETYDWVPLVRAMLRTGGLPLVVAEEDLRAAHAAATAFTTIAVDETGTAGLAGLLRHTRETGPRDGTQLVIFSGARRG